MLIGILDAFKIALVTLLVGSNTGYVPFSTAQPEAGAFFGTCSIIGACPTSCPVGTVIVEDCNVSLPGTFTYVCVSFCGFCSDDKDDCTGTTSLFEKPCHCHDGC